MARNVSTGGSRFIIMTKAEGWINWIKTSKNLENEHKSSINVKFFRSAFSETMNEIKVTGATHITIRNNTINSTNVLLHNTPVRVV
mmetsp:Transcript_31693/g.30209  ORF Transcript_31693/g.30209 Transcript_31693/m.30209 type:complete len:86 (-) Transcript_31693:1841-2098(-)